jgi:starch synthase
VKKVLFVTSEAVPFVKTGGLADVTGSLPVELTKSGLDVRVILPKYGDIPGHYKDEMEQVGQTTIHLGWRQQFLGIEKLVDRGITYYFIDNEYYFKRKGIYGFFDDAERYAYFCRAVLESIPFLDFVPDVLHCHDWHSGLISLYLKEQYAHLPLYSSMKTVFTIHNLRYQGIFPPEIMEFLELGPEYLADDKLEFFGNVNYMKAALVYSDVLTTVSPSYAGEIQQPQRGEKLDGLLTVRQANLVGIINGIDQESYNPATDTALVVNYSKMSPKRKLKNKIKLQELLGLPIDEKIPVIAMVTRMDRSKGLDLVAHVLDDLLAQQDIQFIVLGTGSETYQSMFRIANHRYPTRISTQIYFDEHLSRQIYAGADLFLMPSLYEPCGIGQLIAMRYGCLPIVRETGGLRDTVFSYNEQTGQGNGFSFTEYNADDMLYTIQRALQLYQDKKAWYKLVRNAMKCDYSWKKSALEYKAIYDQLMD